MSESKFDPNHKLYYRVQLKRNVSLVTPLQRQVSSPNRRRKVTVSCTFQVNIYSRAIHVVRARKRSYELLIRSTFPRQILFDVHLFVPHVTFHCLTGSVLLTELRWRCCALIYVFVPANVCGTNACLPFCIRTGRQILIVWRNGEW